MIGVISVIAVIAVIVHYNGWLATTMSVIQNKLLDKWLKDDSSVVCILSFLLLMLTSPRSQHVY